MQRVVGLSILFLVGCVAGGVASQFVVPPARAGSDAPRWEYNCGINATTAQLDEAGAQGWELVGTDVLVSERDGNTQSATSVQFCFKRPR